jgi:hypothetical protein
VNFPDYFECRYIRVVTSRRDLPFEIKAASFIKGAGVQRAFHFDRANAAGLSDNRIEKYTMGKNKGVTSKLGINLDYHHQ